MSKVVTILPLLFITITPCSLMESIKPWEVVKCNAHVCSVGLLRGAACEHRVFANLRGVNLCSDANWSRELTGAEMLI